MPTFTAIVRKRGINPYVDVPAALVPPRRGPIPVRATLRRPGGTQRAAFQATLMPLLGRHVLYVNAAMRAAAGVAVGDRLQVAFGPDAAPRRQPMHPALGRALGADALAKAAWGAWPPSRRKEVLTYLNSLKGAPAVNRNVAKVVALLRRAKADP